MRPVPICPDDAAAEVGRGEMAGRRQHPAVGEFRKVACFAEEAFEGFGISSIVVGAAGETDVLIPV